jgi:hypothetical protein
LNKDVARSLFSIDHKSININDVNSIVSKNKNIFLKHLGSFSTTMHDAEGLRTMTQCKDFDESGTKGINQNNDDLFGEGIHVENGQDQDHFDLLDIDIQTTNTVQPQPTNVNNFDNNDLFGLDIPSTNVQPSIQTEAPKQ